MKKPNNKNTKGNNYTEKKKKKKAVEKHKSVFLRVLPWVQS